MSNSNITPQYQSYGQTSARSERSPAELVTFKVPLTPVSKARERKRKVKVMDEDEYVENVEKIIERDFFPELEKLKAQSEYIDARDRNDQETMSRLEEKYSGVRPDTGRRLASPATFTSAGVSLYTDTYTLAWTCLSKAEITSFRLQYRAARCDQGCSVTYVGRGGGQ